jgi:hypothetical protein
MKAALMKRILFTIPALLLFSSFIPGCTPPQQPEVGFDPQLSLSERPVLGKPVKVALTFTTDFVPKGLEGKELYYTARIELPPGTYKVVEGDLEQKGKFSREAHILEATIVAMHLGDGTITARVARGFSPDDWGAWDGDSLFIQIGKEGATVSDTQPPYSPLGGIPRFDANDPTAQPEDNPPTIVPYDKAPRPSNTALPTPGASGPREQPVGFDPQLSLSERPVLGKPVKLSLSFILPVAQGLDGKEPYSLASIER